MAKRIQRRRTKGWRMPEDAVYVARPSKWGNPFAVGTRMALARVPALDGGSWEYENRISADGIRHDMHHADGTITVHHIRCMTREECVDLYRAALLYPTQWLRLRDPKTHEVLTMEHVRRELRGHDLACWCPLDDADGNPVPCHADVLLEIANGNGS